MPSFSLLQLVKGVNVSTLDTGDKQGTISLRTVRPGDCLALLLLANKTMVKVTYEYVEPDGDEPGSVGDGSGDAESTSTETTQPKASRRHNKNRKRA